jgi:hypothetical protein
VLSYVPMGIEQQPLLGLPMPGPLGPDIYNDAASDSAMRDRLFLTIFNVDVPVWWENFKVFKEINQRRLV